MSMSVVRFLFTVSLFAAAVTLSSQLPTIAFNHTAGMNLTNTSDLFFYRNATISIVDFKNPVNGIFATNNKLTAPYNIPGSGLLVGSAEGPDNKITVPPSCLGFFSFGQEMIDPHELALMIYYGTKNNITKSFVALMLLGVIEYAKDGGIVDFLPFNASQTSGNAGWTQITKLAETDEGVSAYTTTYTSPNHVEFRLTAIGSDRAGILTYGWTPVSPMSTSYVLEINNYPYKNTETHLGLVFATSLKRSEGVFARNMTVRLVNEEDILSYVSFPNYVYADGKMYDISIAPPQSKFSKVSVPADMANLVSMFFYQENGLVRYHVAHFPRTALDIVYGMAVGGGDPVHRHFKPPTQKQTNAAASLFISFVSLVMAALLLF